MCEELSYQIINTITVNQAAFCFYVIRSLQKSLYKKVNISVGGSEQCRVALF